ncbi:MAG: PorV/PorQ family protein [Elusimicrobia bacterium]|nr:PorV/PorQ family protein [Elusimicrobiota bacterium]
MGRIGTVIVLSLWGTACAWAGEPGTAGAAFLKIGAGPRATAMGESHVAVADDAYAAYWNPAGLSQMRHIVASFMHHKSFQDISQQHVNLAYPVSPGKTFGGYVTRLSVEPIAGYNAAGAPAEEVTASDLALALAYGQKVHSRVSVGLAVKWIKEDLGPASASTVAGDAGALINLTRNYGSRIQESRLGVAAKNIGSGLTFDKEEAPLPSSYQVGIAARVLTAGQPVNVSLDQNFPTHGAGFTSFGFEYWVNGFIALRTGFRTEQDAGSGWRGGVGIKAKSWELAYSFAPFGILGDSQRVGVSVRFKNPKGSSFAKEDIADSLKKAREALSQQSYGEAMEHVEDALKLDQRNGEALALMDDIHDGVMKSAALPLETLQSRAERERLQKVLEGAYRLSWTFYLKKKAQGISREERANLLRRIIAKYAPNGIDTSAARRELEEMGLAQ